MTRRKAAKNISIEGQTDRYIFLSVPQYLYTTVTLFICICICLSLRPYVYTYKWTDSRQTDINTLGRTDVKLQIHMNRQTSRCIYAYVSVETDDQMNRNFNNILESSIATN